MILGARMEVRAIQDRGCLSAAKFLYHFPNRLSREMVAGFTDCDFVLREFSKIVPFAKDLLSIRHLGEFRAELIIGGSRAVVYFDGSADAPPLHAIEAFALRLKAVGYETIEYSEGPRPSCDECPLALAKGCAIRSADRPRLMFTAKQ